MPLIAMARMLGKASGGHRGDTRLQCGPGVAEPSLGVHRAVLRLCGPRTKSRTPTKTRWTSQPLTPPPQQPALSVNGTEAADWSACGEACFPCGCVPVVLTFLASCLWEGLRFHNNPLHLPTRGQHLRSPVSKKPSYVESAQDRSKMSQEQNPQEVAHSAVQMSSKHTLSGCPTMAAGGPFRPRALGI